MLSFTNFLLHFQVRLSRTTRKKCKSARTTRCRCIRTKRPHSAIFAEKCSSDWSDKAWNATVCLVSRLISFTSGGNSFFTCGLENYTRFVMWCWASLPQVSQIEKNDWKPNLFYAGSSNFSTNQYRYNLILFEKLVGSLGGIKWENVWILIETWLESCARV